MKKPALKLNADHLRSRLKLKSLQSSSILKAHHPQAVQHLESKGVKLTGLRSHAARVLTSGVTLASILMPPAQVATKALSHPPMEQEAPYTPNTAHQEVSQSLKAILPTPGKKLDQLTEKEISEIIFSFYGINATAELEGNRLNDSYGYIGAEQHLPRFPGDTVEQHDEVQSAGITPGRGAWGYFARSKSELTPDLIEKEKYYFAVQTLYLSDWSSRLNYLRNWYKYRKMVAVNPVNGKAIVGVVADAGPAWWTGKVFGGSPEVMKYLNMKDGKQKGGVVLFFVDDPENKVPLGPLEYNLDKLPKLIAG